MKLAVIALVGLFGLCVLAHCRAQDTPQLNLSCDQIVRMGQAKFLKRFSEVTHDDSTMGIETACAQYSHCRRKVNDAQARALPAQRQEQVRQIREALVALDTADNQFGSIQTGGGTMWLIVSASAEADREDFLTTLIADLRHPAPSSRAARRDTDSHLRTARKNLAALAVSKTPKDATPANPDARKDYKRTYADAVTAFARLQGLTRALPDVAARHVAREAASVLAPPTDTSGVGTN